MFHHIKFLCGVCEYPTWAKFHRNILDKFASLYASEEPSLKWKGCYLEEWIESSELILSTCKILAKTPKYCYIFLFKVSIFGTKIGKNETFFLCNRFSTNSLFNVKGASAEACAWFFKGKNRPLKGLIAHQQPCMGATFGSAADENEDLIYENLQSQGK